MVPAYFAQNVHSAEGKGVQRKRAAKNDKKNRSGLAHHFLPHPSTQREAQRRGLSAPAVASGGAFFVGSCAVSSIS